MTKSRDLSIRAEQRLDKIFRKEGPITHDPLLCEIAIAQVQATLAVASAIQENGKDNRRAISDLQGTVSWLGWQISELDSELEQARLRRQRPPRPKPTPSPPKPRPWWQRLGWAISRSGLLP